MACGRRRWWPHCRPHRARRPRCACRYPDRGEARRIRRAAPDRISPTADPGYARIAGVADDHAGLDVFRRGAQDDELRAAEIDEVMHRDDRHPRRVEAHFHVLRCVVDGLAQAEEHVAACRDGQPRRSIGQRGLRRLADGAADRHAPGAGPVHLVRGDRHRLAALLDRDLGSRDRRVGFDRGRERASSGRRISVASRS